jgi:hypothetical protein
VGDVLGGERIACQEAREPYHPADVELIEPGELG